MKLCTRCGKYKEKTEFHKDKNSSDGFYYRCKDCRREIKGLIPRPSRFLCLVDGYKVYDNNHYPIISINGQKVRIHRYIAEKKIGRKLYSYEDVHHIDGNKKNWNPINLVVLTRHNHHVIETTEMNNKLGKIKVDFKCKKCGKVTKYWKGLIAKGKMNPDKYICMNCRSKVSQAHCRDFFKKQK